MTQPNQSDANLLDEAIDLVIRLQNDPDNPVAAEMIRAWRARGPRHDEIWTRVATAHGASGLILAEKRRIERRESLGLNRRNLMLGGLCLLGGAVGWMAAPGLILAARADVITEKAERRRISLPDGSVATLGPQSALAYDFDSGRRHIRLLDGMCFVEAAAGSSPPFTASCGDVQVNAAAAAFELSTEGGFSRVSAAHGAVEVVFSGQAAPLTLSLQQQQWLRLDDATGQVDRGLLEEGQVASWRDNLLIADQEPVAALVARIGRWTPGRVVVADPFLGGQRVSGVYDLNDPIRALEAVALPVGARVRQISSMVTVISPL
jgi:transmembrane sensor